MLISAASVWGIAIMRRLGKPEFDGSPAAAIAANSFDDLAILPIDVEHAGEQEWARADAFDRLLVAQAKATGRHTRHPDAVVRGYG